MKFSIITRTWNGAAYLQASIDSVPVQAWPHIAYVFAEGGLFGPFEDGL